MLLSPLKSAYIVYTRQQAIISLTNSLLSNEWKKNIDRLMPTQLKNPMVSGVWSKSDDIIMSGIASQITGVTIVCPTVGSGTDQRKHQSPMSLAFVRGIRRSPVNSPYKRPVTRKTFPYGDVIMWLSFHYKDDTWITKLMLMMMNHKYRNTVLILKRVLIKMLSFNKMILKSVISGAYSTPV